MCHRSCFGGGITPTSLTLNCIEYAYDLIFILQTFYKLYSKGCAYLKFVPDCDVEIIKETTILLLGEGGGYIFFK